MVLLTVVYFVVHYMFASLTAHTTALLPVLLTAAIVDQIPEKGTLARRGGAFLARNCRTRNVGEAYRDALLLYAGINGDHFTGRHWSKPDLLRQRVCQPEGILDSRADFRCGIYVAVLLLVGVPYLRFYLG